MTSIRDAIDKAVEYLIENPEAARYTDSAALARLGAALSVSVDGPNGEHVDTDMSPGIGGTGQNPSPGWFFRAAIASCVATTVGMEAERAGVILGALEVEVDSESDDRGILGMDASVPAGPLSTRIRIRASADGVDPGRLREIIEVGANRCPVCDATKRAVTVSVEIERP